jgi:hypothetical protein
MPKTQTGYTSSRIDSDGTKALPLRSEIAIKGVVNTIDDSEIYEVRLDGGSDNLNFEGGGFATINSWSLP